MMTRRAVYLDHSATTPTDSRVIDSMLPYFAADYGNSASAHAFGRKAEDAVETARETVARILNCDRMKLSLPAVARKPIILHCEGRHGKPDRRGRAITSLQRLSNTVPSSTPLSN